MKEATGGEFVSPLTNAMGLISKIRIITHSTNLGNFKQPFPFSPQIFIVYLWNLKLPELSSIIGYIIFITCHLKNV